MMLNKLLVVCLLQVLAIAPAIAANVSVVVKGVFFTHDDPQGLLPFSEPLPGTEFHLAFTYDDATADRVTPGPTIGDYTSAASSAVLNIGGQTFDMFDENRILILTNATNTVTGATASLWSFRTSTRVPTAVPGETIVSSFGLTLISEFPSGQPSPLASDDLIKPVLSEWDQAAISYIVVLEKDYDPRQNETLAQSRAHVTSISIVPIPAAVWLFGSGLALLGWLSRRF